VAFVHLSSSELEIYSLDILPFPLSFFENNFLSSKTGRHVNNIKNKPSNTTDFIENTLINTLPRTTPITMNDMISKMVFELK
jgi:hypothetical protein